MNWHPDVPDLPISKSKEIERLEQADRKFLDSLPRVEVDELIEQAAYSVAQTYHKEMRGSIAESYDDCLNMVSIALRMTGGSIGGQVGAAMISSCDQAAEKACQIFYPPPT